MAAGNGLIQQVLGNGNGQEGPPQPPIAPVPPQPAFANLMQIRVDNQQTVQNLEHLANLVAQQAASNIEMNHNVHEFGRNVEGSLQGLAAATAVSYTHLTLPTKRIV